MQNTLAHALLLLLGVLVMVTAFWKMPLNRYEYAQRQPNSLLFVFFGVVLILFGMYLASSNLSFFLYRLR